MTDQETQETSSLMGAEEVTTEESTSAAPEGLPAEFWNEEAGAHNIDAMLSAYNEQKTMTDAAEAKALGLRQKLSKGVPDSVESIEGFKFETSDELSPFIGDDDVGMAAFSQAALDAGLNNDQFNTIVNGYMKAMIENGTLQAPLSDEAAQEANDSYRIAEMAKLGDNGEAVVAKLQEKGRELLSRGTLSESEYESFKEMSNSATAIRTLQKIMGLTQPMDEIPVNFDNVDGLPSDEELSAMTGDDRYDGSSAYYHKVKGLFNQRYGATN